MIGQHGPPEHSTWAVVLAAGEGSRLASFTRDNSGASVPKQFCSLRGGVTLLEETISRAEAFVETQRVLAVVAYQHRRWWQGTEVAMPPPGRIIVQPKNRGTANGILLAALSIARQDALARLVFLPSDHFVEDEAALQKALKVAAMKPLRQDEILILGLDPTCPDPDLGYIVPNSSCRPLDCAAVRRFAEKPASATAAKLMREGALWNSFIFVAGAGTLIELMRRGYPSVVADLESAIATGAPAVRALYERLADIDFSRDLLQGGEANVSVLRVPECGWSDLGTPTSVLRCLKRLPQEIKRTCYSSSISLAVALAASAA